MKFTLQKAFKFGWKGLIGWAYNSKGDFPNASTAYFEVTTSHGKVKTTLSDRVYLILKGEGTFTIGNETTEVKQGDVIIIPKNTPYDYKTKKGTLKLFLVHIPAYDQKHEIKLG